MNQNLTETTCRLGPRVFPQNKQRRTLPTVPHGRPGQTTVHRTAGLYLGPLGNGAKCPYP